LRPLIAFTEVGFGVAPSAVGGFSASYPSTLEKKPLLSQAFAPSAVRFQLST
jgi:hypothetical protein